MRIPASLLRLAPLLAALVAAGCGSSSSGETSTSSSGASHGSSSATGSTGSGGEGGGGGSTASSTASTGATTGSGGTGGSAILPALTAKTTSTRFVTADAMLAAIEMQISGEPFAELLGRDLGGYDRFSATTNQYTDPATGVTSTDLLGFSLAVESYEYSKQPMNNLSFESGAGLSLQFGPVLNPAGATGDAAYSLLLADLQHHAKASRASGALVGKDFVAIPPPAGDATNPYGWAGFWPVFAEYRSFDPAIQPSKGADHQCSLAGAIDEPAPPGSTTLYVGDYECDATTLNLVSRDTQVEKVLEPAALGFAAWKQGLWAINYWSSLHDVDQNPISVVPAQSMSQVGVPANSVVGQFPSPLDPTGNDLVFGKAGTYFGDVSLEGWQGLVMLEELDNKAQFLLSGMTTADGAAVSGFASVGAALDYDYSSPARWWPAAIAVTETATAGSAADARKLFPRPTAFTVQTKDSRLTDLGALLGGFAQLYAMTDDENPDVGGTQPFLATFDGDPFAADNGMPDGEATPHDRALAVLKVALVNVDRLHFDKTHAVLVDTATPAGGSVTQGTTVSTSNAAYAIVGLRTALRALQSSLTLYSNDTPDSPTVAIPLEQTSLAGAPFSGTLAARVAALIKAEADFISTKLVAADGSVADSYDLQAGQASTAPASIEAQAAAIRGLLEAYLATNDESYRQRAEQVYAALDASYWMTDVRAYRTTAGESATMTWTPRSFGVLHGALRQYWKLVASRPGQEALAEQVLDRIGRGMKLVVDGWNDVNQDGVIDPSECLGGRLQMAERALTGELSVAADGADRDHDCVPEIASAGLPSALAAEIQISRQ